MKRKVQTFHKLRKARFMAIRGDGNAVSVGITGRVTRIGRVHQFGLKDRAEPGAPEIRI